MEHAAERIVIMAGGGVRSHNVGQLIAATGVTEVHSSARRCVCVELPQNIYMQDVHRHYTVYSAAVF